MEATLEELAVLNLNKDLRIQRLEAQLTNVRTELKSVRDTLETLRGAVPVENPQAEEVKP